MKKLIALLITGIFILGAGLKAQDTKDVPIWKKMHYLSEAEMKLPHDNLKSFTPTDPPDHPVRMVGEYEHMQSVLVRYPFGIPTSLIAEMSQHCGVTTIVASTGQQSTVTSIYQGSGVNMDNVDFLIAPSDSYWTRDYGPWFVIDGNGNFGVCDFPYNRPRPNDNDIPAAVASQLGIDLYGMPLEQTGGNWMCTGISQGASTDLVWEENPSLSHQDIQDMVDEYLGVEQYHVLPDPLGEYIKHIDCWGKFLGPNKVLIGSVLEGDPRYNDFEYVADYFASTTSDWGMPYEVFRVYTPGTYPNTPYTNALILNEKVFVPLTGSQYDDDALAVYEEAMPGYEIIGVMYDGWENTDALHCRTKGIADLGMLHIKHIPLAGNIQLQDDYEISATITNYSGSPLYADSVLLYYRENGGAYQEVQMVQQLGSIYSGTIPYVEDGTLVEYYIYAADESGRSAEHPFIGAPDPHEFTVVQMLTGVIVEPDTLLFETTNQAVDGLEVSIRPDEDEDVIITQINQEEYDPFYWWSEPEITFPYTLAAGDSLVLRVYVALVTDAGGDFVQDTMFIECAAGTWEVLIMVDEDIVSDVEDHTISPVIANVYPNPFEHHTRIEFEMKENERAELYVVDMRGNVVAALADRNFTAGSHFVNWDGHSHEGSECPAGVYHVVVKTASDLSVSRLLKY